MVALSGSAKIKMKYHQVYFYIAVLLFYYVSILSNNVTCLYIIIRLFVSLQQMEYFVRLQEGRIWKYLQICR